MSETRFPSNLNCDGKTVSETNLGNGLSAQALKYMYVTSVWKIISPGHFLLDLVWLFNIIWYPAYLALRVELWGVYGKNFACYNGITLKKTVWLWDMMLNEIRSCSADHWHPVTYIYEYTAHPPTSIILGWPLLFFFLFHLFLNLHELISLRNAFLANVLIFWVQSFDDWFWKWLWRKMITRGFFNSLSPWKLEMWQ